MKSNNKNGNDQDEASGEAAIDTITNTAADVDCNHNSDSLSVDHNAITSTTKNNERNTVLRQQHHANDKTPLETQSSEAHVFHPSLDDKSIQKRAYDLIDGTPQDIRQTLPLSSNTNIDAPDDAKTLSLVIESGSQRARITPVAARARAKAASACPTSCKSRPASSSSVPGANYIPSRAPGLSAAFMLRVINRDNNLIRSQRQQQQAQHSIATPSSVTVDVSDAESGEVRHQSHASSIREEVASPNVMFAGTAACQYQPGAISGTKELKQVRKGRYFYAIRGVVGVVVAGVALGIAFGNSKKDGPIVLATTTRFDPFTVDCKLLDSQENPHVLSQCHCHGNISTIANDIKERYQWLTKTWIPTIYPDFEERVDSCNPQNQALIWLASADGGATTIADSTRMWRQRYTLALLFTSWNGLEWTVNDDWLSSGSECDWTGVTCNSDSREVIRLILRNNELAGQLGSDVSQLTSLTALLLNQNGLNGSLSGEIGNKLSQLTSLILDSNQLTGTLPMELSQLSLLQELQLESNGLSVNLSTWIGQLTSLKTLLLSNNTLFTQQSPPPTTTTALTKASPSAASSTTSVLPTELGLLTNLQTLHLSAIGLHGTLPAELFNLGYSLRVLDISSNFLSGTIPTFVGNLGIIDWLAMDHNALTGTIPPEFGHCIDIVFLRLNNNQLHGSIPNSIGDLDKLAQLNFGGNELSGCIPDSLCTFVGNLAVCNTCQPLECSCCICK